MARIETPPPGRAMSFPEWSEAIVSGVRQYLPAVRAVRKGSSVIIRHGGSEAHLSEAGSFCIAFRPGDGSLVTLPGMYDDRRDAFTLGNLSKSRRVFRCAFYTAVIAMDLQKRVSDED